MKRRSGSSWRISRPSLHAIITTKAAQGTSLSFNVTVTASGVTPTGTVLLFDGAAALGAAVQLTGGSATISTGALSVGTHQISAQYGGSMLPSQSGAVTVTVTGTTTVGIVTNPASSNSNATLSLTIN